VKKTRETERTIRTKDPLRSRPGQEDVRLSAEENVTQVSRTRHHRETREFRVVAVELGHALFRLRRDRGWTIEEAAGAFGVEPAFVRRIERGSTNPSLAVMVSIAKAFRVPLKELLREIGSSAGEAR
jgi:ribosome-binding protein aMBF1 (putative translation factor)